MKLGFMQPYFFPYLGYFQLMNAVDQWVAFEQAQYGRHSWINRNRIRATGNEAEWTYITVPVQRAPRGTKISGIQVDNAQDWRIRILARLEAYKKMAPYFDETNELVRMCLDDAGDNLSSLLVSSLKKVSAHLGISTRISKLSETGVGLGYADHPGQWALKLAVALKADEYINNQSGADLFDRSEFESNGVSLSFFKPAVGEFSAETQTQASNLSIIDVLMWNGRETTAQLATLGGTSGSGLKE